MGGTLNLGSHALAVANAELTLESLWSDWPTWILHAEVTLPSGAIAPLRLGGGLRLARPSVTTPAELDGARWSIDDPHRDGDVLGSDGRFELDGQVLEGQLLDAGLGHAIELRVEVVPGDPSVRVVCEGTMKLDDADDWDGVVPPRLERLVVQVDARVDRMYPFEARHGAIWPPGPRADVLASLRQLREAYFEASSPTHVCHDYLTHDEGAGTGSVVVAPTTAGSGESLLVTGMRLLRTYADRSCKGWLPVDRGGQVDVSRVWQEDLQPMLVRGTLTDGPDTDRVIDHDAQATQQAVDWIHRVLTLEFARTTPNPRLAIAIDRGPPLRGKEANRFPWPLPQTAVLGISLRDRWNDKIWLVRTASHDGLLVWSTSC